MNGVFQGLNEGQAKAVAATSGPVLIIAGPGSGKTLTLVRRTLNILMSGLATPEEVVLCTFTEKASLELRDRVRKAALEFGLDADLSGLKVGTLHGIANDFIDRNRHHTRLGANYEVLDELTQQLFIFDNFDDIVPESRDGKFFGTWSTKWTTIEHVKPYFDKITEEMIDANSLVEDADPFIVDLGRGYANYQHMLFEKNKIDFAHLQQVFVELLENPEIGPRIISGVKYVMVDEFQDTNFIQERIVDCLTRDSKNLCVVGDEDQSLYRFRGATVRNILEFEQRHPGCTSFQLNLNYRSHESIVARYNAFMSAHDWSNSAGPDFRFPKTIEPANPNAHGDYPAVVAIAEETATAEAECFAELVQSLKERGTIEDYSQVALLLSSVKLEHSGPYIEALNSRGIKAFCPRARAYFTNEEVRILTACLAKILDFFGENRGGGGGGALAVMANYVDSCVLELESTYSPTHSLHTLLGKLEAEVFALEGSDTLDKRLLDYVYALLGTEPFTSWVKDANRARNISTLSQLIEIFHRYYGYPIVSAKNIRSLRFSFFNSFLRFLYDGGINEYEDKDQPFPLDHVQIMTIHQSKGLEFPVVAVGSLAKNISVTKKVDETLSRFYQKPPFEPMDRITGFDRMRLHYVAFSRPQNLLILTHGSDSPPKPHFSPIWDSIPVWPGVRADLEIEATWEHTPHLPAQRSYSFTSDLKVYETCPRQYQFFRDLEFAPARTVMVFFGLLVHQTIEDIHRRQLDGEGSSMDEGFIQDRFNFNYKNLALRENRQMAVAQKEAALKQVLRYWRQNQSLISRVVETEIDVTVQKDNYILEGAIDLVASDRSTLDILDFKAQQRPAADDPMVESYYNQLCIYAHILEKRYQRRPDRLIIYWTAEQTRDEAMMVFPYKESDVAHAVAHFDTVVRSIQAQEFEVHRVPEQKVCNECDLRSYCYSDGTLRKSRS